MARELILNGSCTAGWSDEPRTTLVASVVAVIALGPKVLCHNYQYQSCKFFIHVASWFKLYLAKSDISHVSLTNSNPHNLFVIFYLLKAYEGFFPLPPCPYGSRYGRTVWPEIPVSRNIIGVVDT
jgi:hypothetical protein